jgi:hypothetical protein
MVIDAVESVLSGLDVPADLAELARTQARAVDASESVGETSRTVSVLLSVMREVRDRSKPLGGDEGDPFEELVAQLTGP